MYRHLIGLAALAAGGFALWSWVADSMTTVGIATRVSVILGAIWIAFPVVQKVNARSLSIGALSLLVLVLRPRAAIIVLPVLWWAVGRSPRAKRGEATRYG
jgi:hypothetical protein